MALSIFRSAAAVICALLVASLLVIAVEGFSAVVHPFPADFDGSYDEMIVHVARYPAWVLVVCGLMWAATVFASVFLATRLGSARHPAHGYAIGAFLILAVIFNMYHLPYPLWFEIFILLAFLLAIHWGVRQGRSTGVTASTVDDDSA